MSSHLDLYVCSQEMVLGLDQNVDFIDNRGGDPDTICSRCWPLYQNDMMGVLVPENRTDYRTAGERKG